jgi:hypothetical protein
LTFIGHTKDSLWSVDLFRCESIALKMHWVLVVMDQSTRRIIGFAVHAGKLGASHGQRGLRTPYHVDSSQRVGGGHARSCPLDCPSDKLGLAQVIPTGCQDVLKSLPDVPTATHVQTVKREPSP